VPTLAGIDHPRKNYHFESTPIDNIDKAPRPPAQSRTECRSQPLRPAPARIVRTELNVHDSETLGTTSAFTLPLVNTRREGKPWS